MYTLVRESSSSFLLTHEPEIRSGSEKPKLVGQQQAAGGTQAQEEVWDLAPTGGNQCSGAKQPFTEDQAVYLTNAPDRIGPSITKARYVEYTDDTFTTPMVRSPA